LEYCRRARRLRARYGGNRAKLYRALLSLAGEGLDHGDTEDTENEHREEVTARGRDSRAHSAEAFAALVREQLAGSSLLCYSARRGLLGQAAGYGLTPFHANLVIAAVQHEHVSSEDATPPRRWRLGTARAAALLVAAELLALTGWWMLAP
jgi:hypothetical protein